MSIYGKRIIVMLALTAVFQAAGLSGEGGRWTDALNEMVYIQDAEVPLSGLMEAEPADAEPEAEPDEDPQEEDAQETPPAAYAIHYQAEDGTPLLEDEATGDVLPPAREGFVFLHWADAETGEAFNEDQPLTRDVTLIAVYEAVAEADEPVFDAASILQVVVEPEVTQAPESAGADAILAIATIAPQEAPSEAPGHVVRVRLETSGPLNLGDAFTLRAELDGYEGEGYSLQWQRCRGGVWQDIEGAQGESFTQTLTRENAGDTWRVLVDR